MRTLMKKVYFRDLFDILRKKGQGRVYYARFQCVRPCMGFIVGGEGLFGTRGFSTFPGEKTERPHGEKRQIPG